MDSQFEKTPPHPKRTSEIQREMTERGFTLAGLESLTKIVFTEDALFKARQYRSKEDVREEYQHRFGNDVEIELVSQEGLGENQQAVLVFVKRKPKNS